MVCHACTKQKHLTILALRIGLIVNVYKNLLGFFKLAGMC